MPAILLAAATGVEASVLMMEGLHGLPSPPLAPAPGWAGLALLGSALLWIGGRGPSPASIAAGPCGPMADLTTRDKPRRAAQQRVGWDY